MLTSISSLGSVYLHLWARQLFSTLQPPQLMPCSNFPMTPHVSLHKDFPPYRRWTWWYLDSCLNSLSCSGSLPPSQIQPATSHLGKANSSAWNSYTVTTSQPSDACLGRFLQKASVFIFQDGHNKPPWAVWLTATEISSLLVLENEAHYQWGGFPFGVLKNPFWPLF